MTEKLPLFVDLDGTLVRTDMLYESFLFRLKNDILLPFKALFWILGGKANLKSKLASGFLFDPERLPYNKDVLAYVRCAKECDRRVVLATASDYSIARRIADHLGCFDAVFGTSDGVNRSGQRKLERIILDVGSGGFEYIGNDSADFPIWKASSIISFAEPVSSVTRWAKESAISPQQFGENRQIRYRDVLKSLRIHQWLKNLLIFVPLLAAHKIMEIDAVFNCIIAFFSFGFCASGVYLINDMLDLEADRLHPRKRFRSFASGDLDLKFGLIGAFLLLSTSGLLCLALPLEYFIVLCSYLVATFAYSLSLKRKMAVDVTLLAALYTSRIIAGAAAILVVPSFWLLAFSMFLFFGLAMVKRFAELKGAPPCAEGGMLAGRDYGVDDLHVVMSLGSASGYVSVLVLALYINSSDINKLYSQPLMLWLLCPLLLFWLTRVWLLASRGLMHDDPVVFAARDSVSLVIGFIVLSLLSLASIL